MKASITAHERLQLIGLLTLAGRHSAALTDIEAAAMAIVGETEVGGHVSDAVYDDGRRDADALLDRLHIGVVEP